MPPPDARSRDPPPAAATRQHSTRIATQLLLLPTRRHAPPPPPPRQGVWEKDEDRKHDSFRAFEEVLQLAVEKDADMLLLGGDLFHDNKPSRTTVIRTIELLNRYCLGDRPVSLELLSNQADNFVAG